MNSSDIKEDSVNICMLDSTSDECKTISESDENIIKVDRTNLDNIDKNSINRINKQIYDLALSMKEMIQVIQGIENNVKLLDSRLKMIENTFSKIGKSN